MLLDVFCPPADLGAVLLAVSFPHLYFYKYLLLWNLYKSHLPWIGNAGSCIFKVPVLCQASVDFPDSTRQVSCLFKDVGRHLLQSLSWTFNSSKQEQEFRPEWTIYSKSWKLWHVSLVLIKTTLACYYLKEG